MPSILMPIHFKKANLVEFWQMLDVRGRDRLEWATGLDPGFEAACDDLGGAVLFFELAGDANAGGVAGAGAVEIDFALGRHELSQGLKLLTQPVGLDADGVLDALGSGIVLAMGADVGDDEEFVVGCGLHALVELFGGDTLDAAETVVMQGMAEQPEHVKQDDSEDGLRREMAGAHDPTDDDAKEWREEEAGGGPGGGVKKDAAGVELEKARDWHVEAAGQRSSDGAETGDEFGKEERALAAAVEGPRRVEDAGLRVETETAEPGKQPPSGEPAAKVEDGIAGKGGTGGTEDHPSEVEGAGMRSGSGREQNNGDGQGESAGGEQKDDRRRRIPMVLHCDEQVHGPCISPRIDPIGWMRVGAGRSHDAVRTRAASRTGSGARG